MKIEIESGLPFVTVSLSHGDQQINLKNVLLDTGSEGTIFATDTILAIGLKMELDDMVRRIRGVGGAEFVFDKQIDCISLGDIQANDFEIEVGAMAYALICLASRLINAEIRLMSKSPDITSTGQRHCCPAFFCDEKAPPGRLNYAPAFIYARVDWLNE